MPQTFVCLHCGRTYETALAVVTCALSHRAGIAGATPGPLANPLVPIGPVPRWQVDQWAN